MKWVMHSRDGGRFVCQSLAASLQQVGHKAGSGLRTAIADRDTYSVAPFLGPQDEQQAAVQKKVNYSRLYNQSRISPKGLHKKKNQKIKNNTQCTK